MKIDVHHDGQKLSISPDPATTFKGDVVIWTVFSSGISLPSLKWEVYFRSGSPFPHSLDYFSTTTIPFPSISPNGLMVIIHRDIIVAGIAEKEGDYKYGVRLTDLVNNIELDDEDPRLIILP
jgi:hypothetical protein